MLRHWYIGKPVYCSIDSGDCHNVHSHEPALTFRNDVLYKSLCTQYSILSTKTITNNNTPQ